jgi:hypothetical protein
VPIEEEEEARFILTVMQRLLVTDTGRSAFSSANCQGQLQIPQSVSEVTIQAR